MKYEIDADDAVLLMENAVAISGEFHGDSAYAVFYETCGEELEGFPGIWDYVAAAAAEFTHQEITLVCKPKLQDSYAWLESVTEFGIELVTTAVVRTDAEIEALAKRIILKHLREA